MSRSSTARAVERLFISRSACPPPKDVHGRDLAVSGMAALAHIQSNAAVLQFGIQTDLADRARRCEPKLRQDGISGGVSRRCRKSQGRAPMSGSRGDGGLGERMAGLGVRIRDPHGRRDGACRRGLCVDRGVPPSGAPRSASHVRTARPRCLAAFPAAAGGGADLPAWPPTSSRPPFRRLGSRSSASL